MSDIFDEVEEDVRKERYEQLWKKYGNYALAGAVVVVLAVGGYRGWQSYQHHLREQASDAFVAAQQQAQNGNFAAAESAFAKLAADSPSGYATVSKFAYAAVMLNQGKREAALEILHGLTGLDDPILAASARLQIGWIEADTVPKAQVQATLAPLLAADNPFRFEAAEILAYVALRTADRAGAIAAYDKLGKDAHAPDGVRQRAAALAEYLKANPDITSLPLAMAPPVLPRAPSSAPGPAPSAPGAAPTPAPGAAPAAAPAPSEAPSP